VGVCVVVLLKVVGVFVVWYCVLLGVGVVFCLLC